MRCLQCGKDLPLFKRLAGGEFCSEEHRREYRREYSVLALNLLARPSAPAAKSEEPVRAAISTVPEPVAVAASAERARVPEMARMVRFRSAPAAVRVVARVKRDSAITPSMLPDRPRHAPLALCGELPNGSLIHMECRGGIQNTATHARERRVEARSFAPPETISEVGLSIMDPQSWETGGPPLKIPVTPCAREAAVLWQTPPAEFSASPIGPGPFAGAQIPYGGFSRFEKAEPPLHTPLPKVLTAQPEAAPEPPIPEPVRKPALMPISAISAGRAKLVQVFPFALSSGGAILVPRSEALPLRPLMVLGPAGKMQEQPMRSPQDLPGPQPVPTDAPGLRLQPERGAGPSSAAKIAGGIAVIFALAGGVFYLTSGAAGTKAAGITPRADDWVRDFARDAKQQRQVSVLRSSMGGADYRIEFAAVIGLKALGWVYRAQDSGNFYVSKIELQKPGENPVFAVTHFAVIHGVEQPRVQIPLSVRVPAGEPYHVRFEAVGNRFTTWVQDQKVDEWMDDRIPSGGAGLFREGVEQFTLRGDFRVTPLVRRNRR